jgi:transposase InsO family protein
MSEDKTKIDLKLPRVLFNGKNYSKWYPSLLNEASAGGLSSVFNERVAVMLKNLPTSTELVCNELEMISDQSLSHFQSSPVSAAQQAQLKYALMNEKGLALVSATLRPEFRTVIANAKYAYDAVELIQKHWHQKTVSNREILSKTLEAIKLEEGKDSLLFVLECENLKEQLHSCGDESLTDSSLAEKILNKLPKSMENLASQIRTNATINKQDLTCESLKALFQSHEAAKRLASRSNQEQPGYESQVQSLVSVIEEKLPLVDSKGQKTLKSILALVKEDNSIPSSAAPLVAALIKATPTKKNQNIKKSTKRKLPDPCENCGPDGGGAVNSRPAWFQSETSKRKAAENKSSSTYSSFSSITSLSFELKSSPSSTDFRDRWISDSGCSAFVTCRRDWLYNYEPLEDICYTAQADSFIQIEGKGNMRCRFGNDVLELCDVYYSSQFGYNLCPVKYFDEQGYVITYSNGKVVIQKSNTELGRGSLAISGRLHGLYVLDMFVIPPNSTPSSALSVSIDQKEDVENLGHTLQVLRELHARLGHLNIVALRKLIQSGTLPPELIHGINLTLLDRINASTLDCGACALGKMTRKSFRQKRARAFRSARPLGLIHADLIGPISVQTPEKQQYVLTVVDDFTAMCWTILLHAKTNATPEFIDLLLRLETDQDTRVATIRYDNGTEIVNLQFRQFCRTKGIQLDPVPRYTPQYNGVIERKNRSLIDMTRTLMAGSGLPRTYWGYAMGYAADTTNVLVSRGRNTSAYRGVSPYELWTGSSPDYTKFHPWGSPVYYYVPADARSNSFKFGPTGAPGYFLGFGTSSSTFRILSRSNRQVHTVPCDEVRFTSDHALETGGEEIDAGGHDLGFLDATERSNNNSSLLKELKSHNLGSYWSIDDNDDSNTADDDSAEGTDDDDEQEPNLDDDQEGIWVRSTRSSRRLAAKKEAKLQSLLLRYNSAAHVALVSNLMALPKTPKTFQEAITSPDQAQWRVAIQKEYSSLIKNGTWTEVDKLPNGRKALPTKWVFKIKLNSAGNIERYKARLVVKGFKQIEGLDYTETFAPVAKFSTIRLMIAVTASLDLECQQMDFSTAFLNGDIEEEIYVNGPEGTELDGKILRLVKSLYGLKQAPRCWNHKINQYLLKNGFSRCHSDNCLYFKEGFYVLLYVDDILLFTSDMIELIKVKTDLMQSFDMRDLGDLEFIVGIRVIRDRSTKKIYLDQEAYCNRILEKFGMNYANPVKTPLVSHLTPSNDLELDDSQFPYRSVVGSLMYLMVGTRPDIAVACSELSRYLEKPSQKHVVAAKRVLRYLKGSSQLRLEFDGNKPLQPVAFADADYANDIETRKSTTGYVVQSCGGPITWKSKIQPTVALSTTEAEYYAAAFCCQEICWIQECLTEIGFTFQQTKMTTDQVGHTIIQTHPTELLYEPIVLNEDNKACIAISKNPEKHARTKHIEVRYHFIRDLVLNDKVVLVYCDTTKQIADILTKPLPFQTFMQHCEALGLTNANANTEI